MALRVTTVIMACTNSDQVKQSIDSLEKYRLFTESKLKQFILKEFDQCRSILRKIMLEGEIYHLLTQLPLTVEERNGSRTKTPQTKTPRQKPPDKNPLDKNPPCQKRPGQKPPDKTFFQKFYNFCF